MTPMERYKDAELEYRAALHTAMSMMERGKLSGKLALQVMGEAKEKYEKAKATLSPIERLAVG